MSHLLISFLRLSIIKMIPIRAAKLSSVKRVK